MMYITGSIVVQQASFSILLYIYVTGRLKSKKEPLYCNVQAMSVTPQKCGGNVELCILTTRCQYHHSNTLQYTAVKIHTTYMSKQTAGVKRLNVHVMVIM